MDLSDRNLTDVKFYKKAIQLSIIHTFAQKKRLSTAVDFPS